MLKNPRTARGFSIIEALVALTILVVLGSVMIPAVTRKISGSQSANMVQGLRALNIGIQQFRENVGRYPSNLGQLVTFAAGTQLDICSLPIPAADISEWRGPYLSGSYAEVGSAGIPSGDATIQLSLGRVPSNTASSTDMLGVLTITVLNVDQLVADETDIAFDTDDSGGPFVTGSVRYNANVGQPGEFGRSGTLTMRIPIRGC